MPAIVAGMVVACLVFRCAKGFVHMIIPLLAGMAALFGGGTLAWYYNLSERERKEADAIAMEFARDLYGVAVDQLTESQANQIHNLVRRRFAN
jgi:hypothetical protein